MMMKTGKRIPVYNTFVSNMYMFNESKQSGQTVWQPDQTTAGFNLIYTAVLQSFLSTQTLVSSKTKNLLQFCLLCNNKQLVGQPSLAALQYYIKHLIQLQGLVRYLRLGMHHQKITGLKYFSSSGFGCIPHLLYSIRFSTKVSLKGIRGWDYNTFPAFTVQGRRKNRESFTFV